MPEQLDILRATFAIDGLSGTWHVLRAEGTEGVSRLFDFRLVLATTDNDVDLTGVLGRTATLTLARGEAKRHVHGVVAAFQHQDRGEEHTFYHVTLVPRLWRLLHRHDCRLFQDLDLPGIVAAVLKEARVAATDYAVKCKPGTAQKLPYCVQYRESDWAFLSRLMETHGFFYFFEHTAHNHRLVVGNEREVHAAIEGEAELPFVEPSALQPAAESVTYFATGETVRAGAVTLCDYNPLRPSLTLRPTQKGARDTDLELYDYPGAFELQEPGKGLARVRLEGAVAGRRLGEGQSDCARLTAGCTFSLKGHSRKDVSGKRLLLTEVHHLAHKTPTGEAVTLDDRVTYENTFVCIPHEVPFRPAPATPRPVVGGVQTAVVVGPSSEEIYTDEHGRVKVQFHWDRLGRGDERSSCWVRVAQPWAGPGRGALWLPRVGDEVVVSFVEGDPDRPLVTGSVYNGQNPPPGSLPGDKTRTTIKSASSPGGGGYNELTFEDKKGEEEVLLHAQRVLRVKTAGGHLLVIDDTNKKVELTTADGHRALFSDNDKKIAIKSKGGHEAVMDDSGGKVRVKSKGGHAAVLDDNGSKVEVRSASGQGVTLDDAASQVTVKSNGNLTVSAGMNLELKAGANVDIKATGLVNIKGTLVNLN